MLRKIIIKLMCTLFVVTLIISSKVEAASFGLSVNKSSVTVGESFSVTISGVLGRVSISGSNVSLSQSGAQWIEGSTTLTGTTIGVGTATVTVTAIDAATTGSDPEEITGSKTVSVKVNEKTVEKTTQSTTVKKTQTNSKPEVVAPKQEEEASSEWGIHSLKIYAVKEEIEEEIGLTPEFNIKEYNYNLNVNSDVKLIKIEKEAYEYTDLIQIEGSLELVDGENNISLIMEKEGKEKLVYNLKIYKEIKKEEVENSSEEIEKIQNEEANYIKIRPVWFVIIELITILISIFGTILVQKLKNKK